LSFVEVNDLKVHYRIEGEGDPLLLIHGLGSDLRSWEFVEPLLTPHFKLIMLDQRGHGRTKGPFGDTIPASQFSIDLDTFLNEIGLDSVYIFGVSMGGLIVQQFAIDQTERIKKMVLGATGPRITEATVDEVWAWREAQVEGGAEGYFWRSTQGCHTKEFIESNPDIIEHQRSKESLVNPDGIIAAGLGLAMHNTLNELSTLEIPTLVIHGEEDQVFPVAEGKLIHETIKDSQLVLLPKTGHSINTSRPKEVAENLIKFLNE
jgi:pimeloyl-ACP methyl ester carboxylesterase